VRTRSRPNQNCSLPDGVQIRVSLIRDIFNGQTNLLCDDEGPYCAVSSKGCPEVPRIYRAQDKHIELQNAAIRHELEQMHGLLAYGLANSGLGAEARMLHASLDDFLTAKNDPDRDAAERSVNLCLKHGSLTKVGKPDTSVLDQYEALEGEESSRFYRKNEATIKSQLQARINASNQP